MKRMDWKKAKRFSATEEKYKPGSVLDNGRVIADKPRDSLDARARQVEKRWLQNNKLDADLRSKR